MVSDMPLYTVMYILKSYLTAGNPLETYKLQRKDEICLGVNGVERRKEKQVWHMLR